MASRLVCLIAIAIVVAPGGRRAGAQDTEARDGVERCPQPLSMLAMQKALEPVVHEMCRRSPTFRRQLLRLADAPGLVVTIAIVRFRRSDEVAATTRFAREQRLLRRADVEISDAKVQRLVELIAHELEHVLEQLDGVNLTYMAQGPGVRSYPSERGPAFDTARARQIGLDVAAEFNTGSVATRQGQGGPR
jgi:hypothetical protein